MPSRGEVDGLVGAFHPRPAGSGAPRRRRCACIRGRPCRSSWRAGYRRSRARRPFEAERAADEDLAVEVVVGEAVEFGREVGGQVLLGEAERIEIGGEMAAHAIGADQHHRADRIVGGALDRRLVERGAGLGGRLSDRRPRAPADRAPGSDRPRRAAGERPVGALPAWPGLRVLADGIRSSRCPSQAPFRAGSRQRQRSIVPGLHGSRGGKPNASCYGLPPVGGSLRQVP